LTGTAAVIGWIGLTLGSAEAGERAVFLRPPAAAAQAAAERPGVDSARVQALLQAARGANAVMCEMAANTVDGRSGWWSRLDANFRAGSSSDAVARDAVTWVRHEKVDAAAVPLLRAALADSDWCVRRFAAPLLARIDAAAAGQAMLAALAAADAGTREMGALALGFAEDPRSIPPLVARLRDDAPRVRATAAWALGEIESREAVRPLIDALADPDALVRESAARALGQVEDAAATPALTDLLKSDSEAPVRRAAAWALGEIVG
jgi:HEAT repeat protein